MPEPTELKIPVFLQDPSVGATPMTEVRTVPCHNPRDGLACDRVEVRWPPEIREPDIPLVSSSSEATGSYTLPSIGSHPEHPAVLAASAFGTVLDVIKLFESWDIRGAPVRWAFGDSPLLLYPLAGEWKQAYYHRDTHTLKFFWFDTEDGRIYTAASRDIVVHETAHAVLDGLAPDLYRSFHPESLAIHESIADLTAAILALRSKPLRKAVLDKKGFQHDKPNFMSAIGEQFGEQTGQESSKGLRNLLNNHSLLEETHHDAEGLLKPIDPQNAHLSSTVLSAALYRHVSTHIPGWLKVGEKSSEEILETVGNQFARLILRSLSYLPPGQLTMADLARTICTVDQAIHPYHEDNQAKIAHDLRRRGALDGNEPLIDRHHLRGAWLKGLVRKNLIEDDCYCRAFIEANRDYLGIPPGVTYTLFPRLVFERKSLGLKHDPVTLQLCNSGKTEYREVQETVIKVAWSVPEESLSGQRLHIRQGFTLALSWEPVLEARVHILTRNMRCRDVRARAERVEYLRRRAERKGFANLGVPVIDTEQGLLPVETGALLHEH